MTRRDWGLIMILSILWGGSFFFVEVALRGLPPLTIVWLRVALAAGLLAVVLRARGMAFPGRAAWGALAVMGLLNNVVPFTMFVVAQGQITGGLASILNATTPLFTVVVAHFATSDERITKAKALGLTLGFAGVVVMMAGAEWGGALVAKAMCLIAALSYGFTGVWGRRFRRLGVSPLATAFGMLTASSVMMFPVMVGVDRPWALEVPQGDVMVAVVGIAVLSTALAYLIFFRVLASAGATNLSVVTFLIPVSAAALGAVFLGERLVPQHIAGFGLIACGLVALDGRFWQKVRKVQ